MVRDMQWVVDLKVMAARCVASSIFSFAFPLSNPIMPLASPASVLGPLGLGAHMPRACLIASPKVPWRLDKPFLIAVFQLTPFCLFASICNMLTTSPSCSLTLATNIRTAACMPPEQPTTRLATSMLLYTIHLHHLPLNRTTPTAASELALILA